MTVSTMTTRVWAADYGAETFAPEAFARQLGSTIPVVNLAVSDQPTHGILTAVELTADRTMAVLTFQIAHHGESMLGRHTLNISAEVSHGFTPSPPAPAPVTYTPAAWAALAGPTVQCPACSTPVTITAWNRPPRETTFETINPTHRTFEPGPYADVTLSCGCTIHGPAGATLLDSARETPELDPNTVLVVATRCPDCLHSITNHLGGQCDVCSCTRNPGTMATKITVQDPDRG